MRHHKKGVRVLYPIERVVVRPRFYEIPAAFSDPQQRQLELLLKAMLCPVRQSIFLALGGVESANVGELSQRTGFVQTTISTHLRQLNALGLVLPHRRGKYVYYARAQNRLSVDRDGDSFTLTLHGEGLSLSVRVERPNGAGMETDGGANPERANE